MMNLAELLTTLQRVACIIIDRHIKVRTLDDDVVVPVTPNMSLLGKTTSAPGMSNSYEVSMDRFGYIEQVEEEWWKLWYPQQCAAGLIFYRIGTDAKVQDNALINNMVLLLTVMSKGNVQDLSSEEYIRRL